jgi:hypothetical protein
MLHGEFRCGRAAVDRQPSPTSERTECESPRPSRATAQSAVRAPMDAASAEKDHDCWRPSRFSFGSRLPCCERVESVPPTSCNEATVALASMDSRVSFLASRSAWHTAPIRLHATPSGICPMLDAGKWISFSEQRVLLRWLVFRGAPFLGRQSRSSQRWASVPRGSSRHALQHLPLPASGSFVDGAPRAQRSAESSTRAVHDVPWRCATSVPCRSSGI